MIRLDVAEERERRVICDCRGHRISLSRWASCFQTVEFRILAIPVFRVIGAIGVWRLFLARQFSLVSWPHWYCDSDHWGFPVDLSEAWSLGRVCCFWPATNRASNSWLSLGLRSKWTEPKIFEVKTNQRRFSKNRTSNNGSTDKYLIVHSLAWKLWYAGDVREVAIKNRYLMCWSDPSLFISAWCTPALRG